MMGGTILFFVLIGVVISMMMKGGRCCAGHNHHEDHGEGGKNDTWLTHHHMEAESPGHGTETDPVCGMEVKSNRIESSHLGRTFHCCSEQCRKLFNLNPSNYAGA